MFRSLTCVLGISVCLSALSNAAPCRAQSDVAVDLSAYLGKGINAYFSGDHQTAWEYFSQCIGSGSEDPLCYYFSGLNHLARGSSGEAEFDIQRGAELEVRNQVSPVGINRMLARVQGGNRLELERIRQQTKASIAQSIVAEREIRYEKLRTRLPALVLSKPKTREINPFLPGSESALAGNTPRAQNVPAKDEPLAEDPADSDLADEMPADEDVEDPPMSVADLDEDAEEDLSSDVASVDDPLADESIEDDAGIADEAMEDEPDLADPDADEVEDAEDVADTANAEESEAGGLFAGLGGLFSSLSNVAQRAIPSPSAVPGIPGMGGPPPGEGPPGESPFGPGDDPFGEPLDGAASEDEAMEDADLGSDEDTSIEDEAMDDPFADSDASSEEDADVMEDEAPESEESDSTEEVEDTEDSEDTEEPEEADPFASPK